MSQDLSLSLNATIGLYEFARQIATAICPPPHKLNQVFVGKWVLIGTGRPRQRIVAALSKADYELLQQLFDNANVTPTPMQSGLALRQLYRRFQQAEGRPPWVPILRSPPKPPHTWAPPRSWHSPEHLAAHQTHIDRLSDWVAKGDLKAVDGRTGLNIERVDMHTVLLQTGLAEYLEKEMRGSVVSASLPSLSAPTSEDAKSDANPESAYQETAGVMAAPEGTEEWHLQIAESVRAVTAAKGTKEWSYQITGRHKREPWTDEHVLRLYELASVFTWAEVVDFYLQKSDSKLQPKFYEFRRLREGSAAEAPPGTRRAARARRGRSLEDAWPPSKSRD